MLDWLSNVTQNARVNMFIAEDIFLVLICFYQILSTVSFAVGFRDFRY